jgi:hypothetical protein
MARAKATSSGSRTGISPAGRLKPCRHALRAERALPSAVFGPRLARPLVRLAWRLASLIMPFLVRYITCSLFVLKHWRSLGKEFLGARPGGHESCGRRKGLMLTADKNFGDLVR